MQNISRFISKYKEIITFTLLIIISLSLISTGDVSKIGGFRTVLVGTYGQLQNAFSWLPNPGALQSENRALRQLNVELSEEVARMRNAYIENKKLRKLIDFEDQSDIPLISAEIVGKTVIEMRNYATVNKGHKHGIDKGMPVRTDAGLVGVVMSATKNYSLIELLKNRNVRISGMIQRSQLDGIVVWKGENIFKFQNIPSTYDVQKGDIVITSNYSNKYPKDVPIGEIVKVGENPESLFYDLTIEPYVDFETLQEVFVMEYIPDKERLELIKEMEEQLKSRKEQ